MNTSVDTSPKPALASPAVAIVPRKLDLHWQDDTPQYWFDDNPFLTHFMNAFSAMLPQGERFMIDSVRAARGKITDNPALIRDISGFIGQEAHHAKAHTDFNAFLASRGVPIAKLERFMARIVDYLNQLPEQDRIAVTGAIEHFTALFGKVSLSHPDLFKNLPPQLEGMLIWHAIEELEHKAVAYDVFQATDGDYLHRIKGLALATATISAVLIYGQTVFLWQDRSLFRLEASVKGLWWMFGVGKQAGYLRKTWRDYLAFFRRDFHPWQDDSTALLTDARPALERLLGLL